MDLGASDNQLMDRIFEIIDAKAKPFFNLNEDRKAHSTTASLKNLSTTVAKDLKEL